MNGAARWIMVALTVLILMGGLTAAVLAHLADTAGTATRVAVNRSEIAGVKDDIAELKAEQRASFDRLERLLTEHR